MSARPNHAEPRLQGVPCIPGGTQWETTKRADAHQAHGRALALGAGRRALAGVTRVHARGSPAAQKIRACHPL
eukprot:scaffold305705_cov19-Tisochrysis_lutea.AAC.1